MARSKTSPQKTRSTNTRLNSQEWLERAQAIQIYSNSLREADDKVLKLFDTTADQTRNYFEVNARVHNVVIGVATIVLLASFVIALFFTQKDLFLQVFSTVGLISSMIVLTIALVRNPLKNARQMLEKTVRVNVVFLSFVRRLQQSDLALRFVFMQAKNQDFEKIHLQIQEFQNIVDQTSDEMANVLQDIWD